MGQLFMRRPGLADLPPLPAPPAGYNLREATDADASALAALLTKSFHSLWTADKTREELLAHQCVEKTYVVARDLVLVATASAAFFPDKHAESGYLHWVAADPDHKGKGLGYLVTLRVLLQNRDAGHRDSVLSTDDFRLPAIKTYWQLGYRPEYLEPDHAARWAEACRQLGL